MSSALYFPDLSELIEEAFERASGGARRLREGYDFKTARRSLNLLTMEWANRGINLWTLEQGVVQLQEGVAQYTLPSDTVDLIEFALRFNGNSDQQTDIALTRIAMPTYAALPNKQRRGRPTQIMIQRTSTPVMQLWPVPENDDYVLVCWRMRRIQDAGGAGNATMDVPFRFIPALVAGLAFYMSQKMEEGAERAVLLKQEYEAAFALAASEDRDRSTVRFIPAIGRF